MALLKYCDKCKRLLKYGEVCKCKELADKRRHKEYNKDIDNSFYVSKEWIRLRDYMRIKYKGLCVLCLLEEKIQELEAIHHIIEVEDSIEDRLIEENLIALCKQHHMKVHSEYKNNKNNMQELLFKAIKEFEDRVGV